MKTNTNIHLKINNKIKLKETYRTLYPDISEKGLDILVNQYYYPQRLSSISNKAPVSKKYSSH